MDHKKHRLKSKKDFQQNLLYEVEEDYWVVGSKKDPKMKMKDIRIFYKKIFQSEKLRNYLKNKKTNTNIEKVKLVVIYGAGNYNCSLCTWSWDKKTESVTKIRIRLLPCHRTGSIALHELAHALSAIKYGDKTGHHNEYFCQCYLWLVENFLSKPKSDGLKKEFRKNGIKYLL